MSKTCVPMSYPCCLCSLKMCRFDIVCHVYLSGICTQKCDGGAEENHWWQWDHQRRWRTVATSWQSWQTGLGLHLYLMNRWFYMGTHSLCISQFYNYDCFICTLLSGLKSLNSDSMWYSLWCYLILTRLYSNSNTRTLKQLIFSQSFNIFSIVDQILMSTLHWGKCTLQWRIIFFHNFPQELEIVIGDEHISFTTSKIGSLIDVNQSK